MRGTERVVKPIVAWLGCGAPFGKRETEGFEKPSLMGKSDANECNENSFSNCRVQLALSTKRDGVIFEKFQVSLSSC